MTVRENLGAGEHDCQPLDTKHLPADRIAISPGNVVIGRRKKEGLRYHSRERAKILAEMEVVS